jgi:hypothetical protein
LTDESGDVALPDTFDGGPLFFVGTSVYWNTPGALPSTPAGGPGNRFGAGTFYFGMTISATSAAESSRSGLGNTSGATRCTCAAA